MGQHTWQVKWADYYAPPFPWKMGKLRSQGASVLLRWPLRYLKFWVMKADNKFNSILYFLFTNTQNDVFLKTQTFNIERERKKVKSLSRVRLFATPRTDYSLPGCSIRGIFQARILEWVAISFSRRSSQPRDWTGVSRIVGRRFTIWAINLT